MKASSILLVVVVVVAIAPHPTLRSVSADCLYQGDIMLIEGQSMGTRAILECVDGTTYLGLDLVCGSNGDMIEVEAVHDCPVSEIETYSTPYCVQCGTRGERDSASCASSPDTKCPEVIEIDG